jgi:hypothetical protein
MENSTFLRGRHGWIENYLTPSLASEVSEATVWDSLYQALIHSLPPGTRPPLRWSLSLRPSEVRGLLLWSLYACNSCSKPLQTGYVLELNSEVVSPEGVLTLHAKRLMPERLWKHLELAIWPLSICPKPQTAFLLVWCTACWESVRPSAGRSSRAVAPEQLSLTV